MISTILRCHYSFRSAPRGQAAVPHGRLFSSTKIKVFLAAGLGCCWGCWGVAGARPPTPPCAPWKRWPPPPASPAVAPPTPYCCTPSSRTLPHWADLYSSSSTTLQVGPIYPPPSGVVSLGGNPPPLAKSAKFMDEYALIAFCQFRPLSPSCLSCHCSSNILLK